MRILEDVCGIGLLLVGAAAIASPLPEAWVRYLGGLACVAAGIGLLWESTRPEIRCEECGQRSPSVAMGDRLLCDRCAEEALDRMARYYRS